MTAQKAPLLTSTQVLTQAFKPTAAPDQAESKSIQVTLVADKNALLSQEFLYGSDLQYSSIYDKQFDLYTQSLVIGHVPARFRIVGDELQLVTENRQKFPSDVNHPEQLISRYKILAQTETTITISGANSSAYLTQVMQQLAGQKPGTATAPAYQDHWIRSFEFDANGNYLLQQTSVMLADGSIGEFMESVFPRSTLAPSATFQKFEMDPTHLVGADEGPVARFRMLAGETQFNGEKKIAYAQHFDIGTDGTIDWYVTRNIPDEHLDTVRAAVEGWNRYFLRFKGIERQVLRFMGKLPEGIHLGDPRYNVIAWDSRLVAGAAYESQASDPATGKQSHSLIYMPAAWLQIGSDYWKKGVASDSGTLDVLGIQNVQDRKESRKLGKGIAFLKNACARDLRDAAALLASSSVSSVNSESEIADFAKELAKATLFHEVGHALGEGHNFNGSNIYDRDVEGSLFSTSIMDYNSFEYERAAFFGVKASDGPQLEYDRQILSTLYNGGRDVLDSDPVLPACADAEADFEEGRVLPLCIRYDIEKDPTLSVGTAFDRVTQEKLENRPKLLTLAQAVKRVPALVLTDSRLEKIQTKLDLTKAVEDLNASLQGAIRFYLQAGKESLARAATTSAKSLLVFDESALPQGYVAADMRQRAIQGVLNTLALTELPEPVKAAVNSAVQTATLRLSKSPAIRSMDEAQSSALLAAVAKLVEQAALAMESDQSVGLPKARAYLIDKLARHETVPYYLDPSGTSLSKDIEKMLTVHLYEIAVTGSGRTAVERVSATRALLTYSGRTSAETWIRALEKRVLQERKQARDNDSRELAEALVELIRSSRSN